MAVSAEYDKSKSIEFYWYQEPLLDNDWKLGNAG